MRWLFVLLTFCFACVPYKSVPPPRTHAVASSAITNTCPSYAPSWTSVCPPGARCVALQSNQNARYDFSDLVGFDTRA